ncbi:hypothetical protein EYF80_053557 [Liparis tanakae]|uniref:G-protein coupled receptors family 1 profile domain-containing protein n=1 Tax=Liparis tanakae TaxID=230148 RepID=A0A4Z2F5B3_9TELE|nr:hypothetical protein EYF80_053557 [Liparis tanakae]
MSVYSSSSFPPANSSSITLFKFIQKCYNTTVGTYTVITFTVTLLLLILPLCVFVIYLGFQRWRQQRSGTTTSHSDVVTFHMVAIELMNIVGNIVFCIGVLTRLRQLMMAGVCIFITYSCGQLLFHILTCVERYLAVVHPVTYLGLKKGKGIRLRNISIGCVWLLSFANACLLFVEDTHSINIIYSCNLSFIFMVICFCSLSVLYVLIRPGPGAGGEGRPRADQSKMRAFYTIMIILGVLFFRLVVTAVNSNVYSSPVVGQTEKCSLWFSLAWFTLPSSLVLPLLFIHRAGKLSL